MPPLTSSPMFHGAGPSRQSFPGGALMTTGGMGTPHAAGALGSTSPFGFGTQSFDISPLNNPRRQCAPMAMESPQHSNLAMPLGSFGLVPPGQQPVAQQAQWSFTSSSFPTVAMH